MFLVISELLPLQLQWAVLSWQLKLITQTTWRGFCQSQNLRLGGYKGWRERCRKKRRERLCRRSHFSDKPFSDTELCLVKHKSHLKMCSFLYMGWFFPSHNILAWLPRSKTVDVKDSRREGVKIHIYIRDMYGLRNLGLDASASLLLIQDRHIKLMQQTNVSLKVHYICSTRSLKVSSRAFL